MYLKQTLDTIVHLLSLGPSGVEQQRCKHGAISAMVGKNLPPMHRGAYFQFIFRWIHYCHSIVVNPPERKLAKGTSVDWLEYG